MTKKIILTLVVVLVIYWFADRWATKRVWEGYCAAIFNFSQEIGKYGVFDKIGCHNACGWNNKGKIKCDFWKVK